MAEVIDQITIREKQVADPWTVALEIKQDGRPIKRYATPYGSLSRREVILSDGASYTIENTKQLMIFVNSKVQIEATKDDESVVTFEVNHTFVIDETLRSVVITAADEVVKIVIVS